MQLRGAASSLLVLALVACGDDEPAGTGGGGGDAATGSSSSVIASSSASSSSASGGEGGTGGQGEGGSGGEGGGAEGGGGAGGGEGGGVSAACAELDGDGPRLEVVTVDENGEPVEVDEVLWLAQPGEPFWDDANPAACLDGGEPPCSAWAIDGALAERISVSSARETEAEPTEECFPYASAFVQVHFPEGERTHRQRVHLTLPSDGVFCIDGGSGMSFVNVEHDEQVDEADCLAFEPAAEGPIVLGVVDQDGEPVPATIAHWYYHPEGPDFEGEQPMACLDVRCTTWVVGDSPMTGTIYMNATYSGPINPFVQTGWLGYDGMPFEVERDDAGEIIPISAELVVDTTVESAIGG